jgi:hypothetical protein
MIRWEAKVVYATDAGECDVTHDLEELEQLHDLVERGPHWDAIVEIRIKRAGDVKRLTVEQAQEL